MRHHFAPKPTFRPNRTQLLILFSLEKHTFTSPHSIKLLAFISQLEYVYCAVRAGLLNRLVSIGLFLLLARFNKSPLLAQDKNARRYLSVTSVTLERMLTSRVQSLSFLRTECISMFEHCPYRLIWHQYHPKDCKRQNSTGPSTSEQMHISETFLKTTHFTWDKWISNFQEHGTLLKSESI